MCTICCSFVFSSKMKLDALKSFNNIVNKELDEVVLLKSSSKPDRFKFNIVLPWIPVDNTNIPFKILQEKFTNDTLTKV